MTKLNSHALPTHAPRTPADTIYRDIPQTRSLTTVPVRLAPAGAWTLLLPNESASNGIFLGFGAMTLLTLVYSFTQLWKLLSGGSLEQAIRAIVR